MENRILVGTSGYSYGEWVTSGFYPEGTRSGAMFGEYAKVFPVTELNYTWYQMPRRQAVESMAALAPPGFLVAAKLNRRLTHEIEESEWRGHAGQFRDGISPLVQSGRLVAVLIQFPPSFTRVTASRRYLGALLSELEGLPLAVEFRHVSWADEKVFEEFSRRRVTLVAVDTPALPRLFPRLDVVTNPDLFYVRFHGRNLSGWRSGNMQQQFDYDYSDAELREWSDSIIPSMAAQAKTGLLFFNNHVRAQAPKNAQRMMALLAQAGLLESG